MLKPFRQGGASPRRDDRGFTLVELMVAIVILAIVFVPLLHTFVSGAQTEAKSRQQNNAATAAQTIIENIQASDTATLLASGYTADLSTGVYTRTAQATGNGSTFDTKVTFTPVSDVNSKAVVVSNSMDAVVDMTGADTDALNEFKKQCDDQVSTSTLKNYLTRTITVNSQLQKDGNYIIYVTFTYGGDATYTTSSKNAETGKVTYTQHKVTLSYQSEDKVSAALTTDPTALARIAKNGGPAYSLYLYFAPIVHSDARTYYNDVFNIFNTVADDAKTVKGADYDFNVFLIDTLDNSQNENYQNINYQPVINYYGQHNLDQMRVFSNVQMTAGTNFLRGYTAHTNVEPAVAGKFKNMNFDGTLVEKQQLNRMYDVKVEVFRSGTASDPIVTMNAVKLG